ncbi:glycosyltransferase [Novosphingobium resinovorum]
MLVMPSRYPEPFGLVAIEATWSGLPVILAETALLAQDIVDRGAGISVDPRDTSGFAAAIRRLMQDDRATREMSEAGYAKTRVLALTPKLWLDRVEAILHERIERSTIRDQVESATIPAHIARLNRPANSHHFQAIGDAPTCTACGLTSDEAGDCGATPPSSLGSSPAMISSSRHATS